MVDRQKKEVLTLPVIGAFVGAVVTLAVITYSYNYARANDPSITDFWYYLWQKQYRLLQFVVSLFPIVIGFFYGRGQKEKANLRLAARENQELYRETLEKQEVLDLLMHRVGQAHEEERQRISRELHDGIAQNLSGIILKANSIKSTIGSPTALDQLQSLSDLTKETVVDLRRIIRDLRPVTLDSEGLAPTLERHLTQFAQGHGLSAEFVFDVPERLPASLEVPLFRIVQEALNNIGKHADAARVVVNVTADQEDIRVVVEDDGQGFITSSAKDRPGFGLITMRERAESLGGILTVESHPGAGTRLIIKVPHSLAAVN
jgi:two-component system sensor histidine kinase DegS